MGDSAKILFSRIYGWIKLQFLILFRILRTRDFHVSFLDFEDFVLVPSTTSVSWNFNFWSYLSDP